MRNLVRVIAALVAVGTVVLWLATGAHRGWTETSVAVEKTDEVTGLIYRQYEKRFVAGAEVLAGGLGVAAALGIASLFLRRPTGSPKIASPQ